MRALSTAMLAMALITLSVTAAPSAQAATCSWDSCYTKNPDATGCNSSTTSRDSRVAGNYYNEGHAGDQDSWADVRYTSACGHQAWLRTSGQAASWGSGHFMLQSCKFVSAGSVCNGSDPIYYGYAYNFWDYDDGDSNQYVAWSGMVPVGQRHYRLCSRDAHYNSFNELDHWTNWNCSPWAAG